MSKIAPLEHRTGWLPSPGAASCPMAASRPRRVALLPGCGAPCPRPRGQRRARSANLTGALALGLAAALALGCASAEKPKAKLSPAPAPAPAIAAAPAPSAGGSVKAGPTAPTLPIYFDFDSDQLTPSSQESLKQMAAYLAATPGAVLTIEGHCDETGSPEYNLALGDRRARAAVSYLEALGVAPARLKSISFGEERPAVVGNDDDAHGKNRRGQYDLQAARG